MRTLLQKVIEIGQKVKSVHVMLPEICNCISVFPDVIGVLIAYKDINYYSTHFTISGKVQSKKLMIGDKNIGNITIYYKENPEFQIFEEEEIEKAAAILNTIGKVLKKRMK